MIRRKSSSRPADSTRHSATAIPASTISRNSAAETVAVATDRESDQSLLHREVADLGVTPDQIVGAVHLAIGEAGRDPSAPHQGGSDVVDRALGDHLSLVYDRQVAADPLQLGEDVRGDHDGLAHPGQLGDELAELDPGPGVETRCRLVEDQHLGVVDQCPRQGEALLHALGKGC